MQITFHIAGNITSLGIVQLVKIISSILIKIKSAVLFPDEDMLYSLQ